MWSNQIRPLFCTPPEWWDIHPRHTSRLQEWAKSRKTENTEMPKADMKVKTGWGVGQKKLDLKGDSLRQKQSQQGECAKSDSSDPTSLYSHETKSRSQQFLLLSVLRNPGLVGSPETSRGNIDWKAKRNEYCSISGSWVVYGHLCHQQSDYCLQENPTWFEADQIW